MKRSGPGDLRWFSFPLDRTVLTAYAQALHIEEPESALGALARAIAASSAALGPVRGVAAVDGPVTRLAFLAPSCRETEAVLEAQATAVKATCRRLRYVGWSEAARVATRLAERILDRFGPGLGASALTAIPRGGWLVAGLIGRSLSSQTPPPTGERPPPRIVVDDCALTGIALRRWLDRSGESRVIFAPLFAAGELARQIEKREPRVRAVVTGAELAQRSLGSSSLDAAWRTQWAARLAEQPYWIEPTEFVSFPWNEPQRSVWIESHQRLEQGWRLLPPERCSKTPAPAVPVCIRRQNDTTAGALGPGDEVVWAEVEGHVYVANLSRAENWRLDDVAAVLWKALVRSGDPGAAAAEVVARYEVSATRAGRDLERWVGALQTEGLLPER